MARSSGYQVRRRGFIAALGGAAAVGLSSRTGLAQQDRLRRASANANAKLRSAGRLSWGEGTYFSNGKP
jgi:hypothetical protein